MKAMIRVLILTAMGCLSLYLTACNTTKGAGKDLQSAGQNLQHSAEKNGAN
jgi:predicted small secreted protein